MKDFPTHDDSLVIATNLADLLENGGLEETARKTGLKLHKRISAPVRVTVFGRPGSGKSQILNLLLGRPLIPDGLHPPTMSLSYGREWRLRMTMSNGQTVEVSNFDLSRAVAQNPVYLEMEAPIEALRTFSITEVIAKGGEAEQKAAISWAVRRTDICVWCTTFFDSQDAELWEQMPEHIKDHAYLVLTKAELWAEQGILSDRMTTMADIAASEFHSFYAVAALQALAACKDGMITNEAAWTASGGASLVQALYDHAIQGRQQDLDSARAFLHRHAAQMTKRPRSEPIPSAPAAPPRPATIRPRSEIRVDDNHLMRAREYLSGSARELKEMTISFGSDTAPAILTHCFDIATELSTILSPLADTDAAPLAEDADRAAEMITLLQLEGGRAPATDAVCLLTQISQEIERASLAA